MLRAAIFLLFLGLWTWKLLEPHPVPEELQAGLDEAGLSFVAAKCLHAAGYAFLTMFAFFLPLPRRGQWLVAAFLVVHGVGTEIGQTFVPNRTGRIRDVVIDWLGVGLGLAAVAGWKRYCMAEPARR